ETSGGTTAISGRAGPGRAPYHSRMRADPCRLRRDAGPPTLRSQYRDSCPSARQGLAGRGGPARYRLRAGVVAPGNRTGRGVRVRVNPLPLILLLAVPLSPPTRERLPAMVNEPP